jgi:hypothetical protein
MRSVAPWLLLVLCICLVWGCAHRTVLTKEEVPSPQDDPNDAEKCESEYGASMPQEPEVRGKPEEVPVREKALNIDQEEETRSIYTVIEELESCYRTRDYEKWLNLLTSNYRRHFNNRAMLQTEGWDAENIREFFELLVQTRRKSDIADLEISRVEFVSDNKAYVYVVLNGEEFPTPQHTFIRINDSWMKGLSHEGE